MIVLTNSDQCGSRFLSSGDGGQVGQQKDHEVRRSMRRIEFVLCGDEESIQRDRTMGFTLWGWLRTRLIQDVWYSASLDIESFNSPYNSR